MKTKAIIFDKDGTLLDFDAFWVTVSDVAVGKILDKLESAAPKEEVLRALGIVEGKADINGVVVYGTYAQMAEAIYGVLKTYGYTGTVDALLPITVETYHQSIDAGEIRPDCEDLVGVMERFRRAGIRLAVVTADGPVLTEKCLAALGIADCFDRVYTDDGVFPAKPDPFCIHDFCRVIGVEHDEVVMVGDTMTDMIFAKNGGVRAVGIAKEAQSRKILSETTDAVIRDLSQLFDVLE